MEETILLSDDEDQETRKNVKQAQLSYKIGIEDNVPSIIHSNICEMPGLKVSALSKGHRLVHEIVTLTDKIVEGKKEKKLIEKIKEVLLSTHPMYLSSSVFHKLADQYLKKSKKKPKCMFYYLKQLIQKLLRYPTDCPGKFLSTDAEYSSTEAPRISVDEKFRISKDIQNVKNMPIHGSVERFNAIALSDFDQSTQEKIIRLELLLEILHEKLQLIQSHEIGSDSEEDEEICAWEERLEKRVIEVWKRLCRLTKQKETTNRHIERKISYHGSRYPEINKAVESYVNKRKYFPDYKNILTVIEETNACQRLLIQNGDRERMAQEIFLDIGCILQNNRKKDVSDSIFSRLRDSRAIDPADEDPELEKKLSLNKQAGDEKMKMVLQHYSDLQLQRKLVPEEIPDDVADLSENDDEEESDIIVDDNDDDFKSELDGNAPLSDGCNLETEPITTGARDWESASSISTTNSLDSDDDSKHFLNGSEDSKILSSSSHELCSNPLKFEPCSTSSAVNHESALHPPPLHEKSTCVSEEDSSKTVDIKDSSDGCEVIVLDSDEDSQRCTDQKTIAMSPTHDPIQLDSDSPVVVFKSIKTVKSEISSEKSSSTTRGCSIVSCIPRKRKRLNFK